MGMRHQRECRSGGWIAGLVLSVTALSPAFQALADTEPTQRQLVQHLLRRFAYSGSPAMVNQVVSLGASAWVDQQLKWTTIDDSKSMLNQPPHRYADPLNCNHCLPNYSAFEALVYQHNLLTNRQIQAKMELHWLEHFSINTSNLDPPNMYNYDQAVRKNALGNFAKLVSDVAVTPAMLQWLNNDGNKAKGPNVNWARELMQLYTTGVFQLNPDGTQVLNNGQPVLNYVGADIKAIAKAMSGYNVVFLEGGDPMNNYTVTFDPSLQIGGTVSFLGGNHTIPRNSTAIATVVDILAHQPSTAPFEVTELLKRFVTETPSKKYVSDIVKVWNASIDAPDQLAKVVKAIIAHPEFNASYHALPKQPIEKVFGALRQLPGKMQAASPKACGEFQQYQQAGQSLERLTAETGQELFYPPNVFSFFIPGNIETTNTTTSVTGHTDVFSQLLERSPPQSDSCSGTGADVWIDVPTLLARIGSKNGRRIADYLLDALVDGGSPGLRSAIISYLGSTPGNATIQGAVWLILNSPEYGVN